MKVGLRRSVGAGIRLRASAEARTGPPMMSRVYAVSTSIAAHVKAALIQVVIQILPLETLDLLASMLLFPIVFGHVLR
jgi:hypothetical protein